MPKGRMKRAATSAVLHYGVALAAVAAAFALRLLLEPWLGQTHAYAIFYPVIFVLAYALGRWPAAAATALAAVAGFWAFLQPAFGWGLAAEATSPLALFVITAGVGVWLITSLTSALAQLASEQGELKAVADAHAELFKVLQVRAGQEMQLMAGLLTLQADRDPGPQVSQILRRLALRSQQTALALRTSVGLADRWVDAAAFSAALVRAFGADVRGVERRIEVSGPGLRLPIEVATSLGVAMVESVSWILARRPTASLHVRLEQSGAEARMIVGSGLASAPLSADPGSEAFLFRAMAEQLGARVDLVPEGVGPGSALQLAWPLPPSPTRDATRH